MPPNLSFNSPRYHRKYALVYEHERRKSLEFGCKFLIFWFVLAVFYKSNRSSIGFFLILICVMVFILIINRLMRSRVGRLFLQADTEWKSWRDVAVETKATEEFPVLRKGTKAQECLAANMPSTGRSETYSFGDSEQSLLFCQRHRQLITQALRNSAETSVESRIAIGFFEDDSDKAMLLFRQLNPECVVFFTVHHQRRGNVVDLISHRWALYVRSKAPNYGRNKSDEDIAASTGVVDREEWRSRPDWGALGYWHLVDWICRRNEKNLVNGASPPPATSISDAELNYIEAIVHKETIKEIWGQFSQSTSGESPKIRQDHLSKESYDNRDFL